MAESSSIRARRTAEEDEIIGIPACIRVAAEPSHLLEKFAVCYKMLCSMRRNAELNARSNPPHPSKINVGEYEICPSTYGIMENAYRVWLTGIIDVAKMMSPEFSLFSSDEQWNLAVNFYNRICIFDACYHAERAFPQDASKALVAFTAYLSEEVVDHFFDDCNHSSSNIQQAQGVLHKMISVVPSCRLALRRANLDYAEFLALIILTFWFTDGLNMRDEIVRVGQRYTEQVLRELHAHYRKDLQLTDYAARLGRLFMLISNFDRNAIIDNQSEMYRLLGITNDFAPRLKTYSS